MDLPKALYDGVRLGSVFVSGASRAPPSERGRPRLCPIAWGYMAKDAAVRALITSVSVPSERLREAMPDDLERLILRCLEKDRSARAQDAATLRDELERCEDAGRWSREEARAFWEVRSANTRRSRAPREHIGLASTMALPIALGERTRGAAAYNAGD
jgi:hypothetical protein